MTQRSQIVTFSFSSSKPRAWLVINSAQHRSLVLEMWQGYGNRWTASAWLTAGEYHCRYYSGDDKHAVYHGPEQISVHGGKAMDGLVSVAILPETTTAGAVRILLVEDNLSTLLALEKSLRSQGYKVYAADGYQTALGIARRERIDLAICDINLWDGDGCDLLREMQKLQLMAAIAVTGYTLPEETEHYKDAGFAIVLQKPAHLSDVMAAVTLLSADVPDVPADMAAVAS